MANNVSIAKAKKGDTVMLCMFTGCKTGPKEIVACDKSTITVKTWHGEVTFDRKTGKQIEPMPKNARYASFITVDDGTFVHPTHKKKKGEGAPKKATKAKKAKPEPADEKSEAEEVEEAPAPKKAKKEKAPAKKAKKSEPAPKPEEKGEDWDDDEDDDWDDDDFEEVE